MIKDTHCFVNISSGERNWKQWWNENLAGIAPKCEWPLHTSYLTMR